MKHEEYKHYLLQAGKGDTSYRAIGCARPHVYVEGNEVDPAAYYGEETPPSVLFGQALQNNISSVVLKNILFDSLTGGVYPVSSVESLVRIGRTEPIQKIMGKICDVYQDGLIGSTRSHQNYYHWLVESVPKIVALKQAYGEDAQVYFVKSQSKYHHEFLEFVDPGNKIVPIEGVVYFENAVTTHVSTEFRPNGSLSRHSIPSEQVKTFPSRLGEQLQGRQRRVFISRRDVNTRNLNDEHLLVAELEARGFDCPVMSDLSLLEQAEICANAEVIMSTHGAGLSNMLFRSGRKCKIIEIIPASRWQKENFICMFNLSTLCGFEHYIYDCEYPDKNERMLNQNWVVDHKKILSMIDSILD